MAATQTKTSAFLESLLPEIKTQIGFNVPQLIQAGAVIFIAAVLIMVAYFTIKKLF